MKKGKFQILLFATLCLSLLYCSRPPQTGESPVAKSPEESDDMEYGDPEDPEEDGAPESPETSQPGDQPAAGKKVCTHLVLNGLLMDVRNESPFTPRQMQLPALLKQLRDFRDDAELQCLLIQVQAFSAPLASLWELRNAFAEFRGKSGEARIHLYADVLDLPAYYLATGASTITLHPAGSWEVPGIAAEFTFLRDALNLAGIQADFLQVGKYKGAAENLTRSSMSPELKLSINELLDSLYSNLLTPMAAGRNIPLERMEQSVNQGILSPGEALGAGLIDRVEDLEKLKSTLLADFRVRPVPKPRKPKPGLMDLFSPPAVEREPDTPHIALLQLQGPIFYSVDDPSSLFSDEAQISALEMIKTLEKMKKNKHVKGIILRINSPGGSALASDILCTAIRDAAGERPLVASMGSTAASGGYYLAAASEHIFASPFTLTGSIGVVGGKLVFRETFKKFKVGTELLTRGQNSGLLSGSRPFTDSERTAVRRSMENVYELFLSRVRTTRPKLEKLEDLAQGRIWTGDQAKNNGLVSELGGLQDAAAKVRQLAGVSEKTPVLIYPRPKPWFVQLSEMFEENASIPHPLSGFIHTALPAGKTALRLLDRAALFLRERNLVILPFVTEGF